MLDGDIVRTGLCQDLRFSLEDRAENIRRVGEVARMMANAGMLVIREHTTGSLRRARY